MSQLDVRQTTLLGRLSAFFSAAMQADSEDRSTVAFLVTSVLEGQRHPELRSDDQDSMRNSRAFVSWAVNDAIEKGELTTDTDVPHADGFLTAGSLVGQLLLAKKKVENWHIWIAVDILYVGLYLYKGLVLTAVLYGVFVLLAIAGLRTWSALARKAS